jgi:hypothetical protein
MTKEQQLEQKLMKAHSVGIGLSALLTSLTVEHARLIGGDLNSSLMQTRNLLNESLESLEVKATTPTGVKVDAGPELRRHIGRLLDRCENDARRMLGLAPTSKTPN